MTTKAATVEIAGERSAQAPVPSRPYAPSWLNLFTAWLDGLPGPAWTAYVGFALIVLVGVTAQGWIGGTIPVGKIDPYQTSQAFWFVYPIVIFRYLDGAAKRAWRTFRPAMDVDDLEAERIEYELTVTPMRVGVILLLVAAALMIVSFVSDPVGNGIAGMSIAGAITLLVFEIISIAAIFTLVANTVRQLRMVSRLHDRAVRIDLFEPHALHAFSVLTARTALAIMAFPVAGILTTAPNQAESTSGQIFLVFSIVVLVVGVFVFVLPLRGLHSRFVAEKRRLLGTVNSGMTSTTDDVHASISALREANSLPILQAHQVRADTLNKTLGSLLQERDIVTHLSTWPWDPTTFRAFVSAIALPIVIWLATRLLERVV